MKRLILPLLVVAAAGCTSHRTGETEVGVLVCKISLGCEKVGVQTTLYPPGSTNFFAPFIRDFYTFDIKIQNLEMTQAGTKSDPDGKDDLQFKTTDGNDISMDVTVVWQIDPKMVPDIVQYVGSSTAEVAEKLVRPMSRTLVRDVLNELDSEAVYNADLRFEKAEKARVELAAALAPHGIQVDQVILHEHRFHPEYEGIIKERKLAEQRAQQLKSETEAAEQEALRNLETAKGKVASEVATATGALSQAKLGADAEFYQQQQNAEAIVAEQKAEAEAARKRNEALRGAGGRAMVKLRVAEALEGKTIILVPGGSQGLGVNRLDLNRVIEAAMAAEAKPQE